MREALAAARGEMQGKIDRIVAPGSVVSVDLGGAGRIRILVDRFDVLFARPVLGADGSVSGHYYWAACFEVGFDNGGPQHVRLFKMESVKEERPDLFLFRDQRGCSCFIETIDAIDDAKKADFKKWRAYKKQNEKAFDRLYREFGEEMMEMALNEKRGAA